MIDMKSNKKTSTYEKKKPVGLRILVCAIAVLMIVGIVVSAAAPAIENAYVLKNMSVAYADDDMDSVTGWISCLINQQRAPAGIDEDTGCTVCSSLMILQNCGLLEEEWQFGEPGNPCIVSERNKKYNGKHDIEEMASAAACCGNPTAHRSWYWARNGLPAEDLNKFTGGKLKQVTSSKNSDVVTIAIGAIGGKSIGSMSHDEKVKALKPLWDEGFFMICTGGNDGDGAVVDGYGGSHTSFIAGITDKEIYVADVWDATIKPLGNWKNGQLNFVIPFYSDETSPQSLMGGEKPKADVKPSADGDNSCTVSFDGFMEEGEFVSVDYLTEAPLTIIPTFSDLGVGDQMAVKEWKEDIDTPKDTRLVSILRGVVAFVGIILTFYSAMLYVAFQFDRNQNFIELELLSILTLGRLRVSPEEGRSTFTTNNSSIDGKAEVKASKAKFVVHKDIIIISLVGMAAGILILSGKVYYLIMAVVKFVTNLFE